MLKKIYKKYINFIENLPGKHHYFKMLIAENLALFRKKDLINSVIWTKTENDSFNEYWINNYKRIKSSGNKLFQAFNQKFLPNYIPDFLYATKIESTLNNYKYADVFSDKSLTEVLYKDKSAAKLPNTYLLKSGGIFYDSNRNIIDKNKAKKILLNIESAVIKPTVGGNSGKGVIIGNFDKKGFDSQNNYNILEILDDESDNLIVQEKISQSVDLKTIYPSSINTFRIITYIANSKVNVAPISLRMGTGGKSVDNIHAGGLVIGVDCQNEKLKKNAYKLGYSDRVEIFQKHPDTGIIFENLKINGLRETVNSVVKLHGFTPNIGVISWDMTINLLNEPIIIEANYIGQSVWFPQIVNEQSIFGDDTSEILKKIKL